MSKPGSGLLALVRSLHALDAAITKFEDLAEKQLSEMRGSDKRNQTEIPAVPKNASAQDKVGV